MQAIFIWEIVILIQLLAKSQRHVSLALKGALSEENKEEEEEEKAKKYRKK